MILFSNIRIYVIACCLASSSGRRSYLCVQFSNEQRTTNSEQLEILFAYCLIALLPFFSTVQECDAKNDATSANAGFKKI